jgi:outer membrane protein OmpA-like peptidoglycan-associated protein
MVVKRSLTAACARVALATLAVALVGGCDSVNPVAWYRDLTGVSKNDALDKNAGNQKNLEAGGTAPYPNLGQVPGPPSTALSTIDRDALRDSLTADRANARYTDEQLRAGTAAQITVPPPAPPSAVAAAAPAGASAAAQQKSAAPPRESSLKSPTIPNPPLGDKPAPPPPPPRMAALPRTPVAEAPLASAAAAKPGQRATSAASTPLASIAFADGSSALSDQERNRLSEIAAMQHDKGGTLRLVGHAPPQAGTGAAQQALAGFNLALNRAKEVAKTLSADGVPEKSIAVEAAPAGQGASGTSGVEVFLEH